MNSIKQDKGFAVLITTVLLSIASIAFTAKMASTQLIDNKILDNDYRNNEAFVNAESGINFLLSRIDDPSIGPGIFESIPSIDSAPYQYSSADNSYSVKLTRLDDNTLEMASTGSSYSAERIISLQIQPEVRFTQPEAAVSFNGRLNLSALATINNGCEGLSAADCKSPGNIADYQLVSNPTVTATDLCPESVNDGAFYEPITADNSLAIGGTIQWPYNIPAGSNFFGTTTATDLVPSSLFESTFGVSKDAGIAALNGSASVAKIDMTDGSTESCSSRLQALGAGIDTIYITGNCNVNQHDTTQSSTSENKYFSIGTVDKPKMVFIEGGTFINSHHTVTSIIGLLYFLPGKHDVVDAHGNIVLDADGNVVTEDDSSIDMGGVKVNGAMLSEYDCSHNGSDTTQKHFSVRYDKTILDKLYGSIGGQPPIYDGYSLVQGSWRDF